MPKLSRWTFGLDGFLQGVEGQNTALSDENKRWKWGVIPYVVSDDYCTSSCF